MQAAAVSGDEPLGSGGKGGTGASGAAGAQEPVPVSPPLVRTGWQRRLYIARVAFDLILSAFAVLVAITVFSRSVLPLMDHQREIDIVIGIAGGSYGLARALRNRSLAKSRRKLPRPEAVANACLLLAWWPVGFLAFVAWLTPSGWSSKHIFWLQQFLDRRPA